MTTPKALTEEDVLARAAAAGEPDWVRDRRLEAFKAFRDLEWPTSRVEEWRYTNPRRIDVARPFVTAGGQAPADRGRGIVSAVGDAVDARVRIVDGAVLESRVADAPAEAGVTVGELGALAAGPHAELLREHLGRVVGWDDAFTAVNAAAWTVGAAVVVPAGVRVERPIAVTVDVTRHGSHLPRLLVVAGEGAEAVVYLDHGGSAEATVIETVEVVAAPRARVDVVSAQDWGAGVAHVAAHRATVGRDAAVRSLEVSIGGDTVYVRPDVGLDGPGGEGELFGVYLASEGQQFEHRSVIHHNASHTRSESVYKGALQGDSRATWFGNIRIEEHAKATISDETNRNLILTEGAKADTIPFLEIKTADVVACGHHSSVGQVDETQLFYLTSRGIPRDVAARMLVFGFFAEVLGRYELPGVAEAVLAEIEEEIRTGPTALMDQRRS